MIGLWENRNEQVHGSTHTERQRIMKQRQVLEFKRLMVYRKDVRPSDLGFFPEDEEDFIEQSTVQQLRDYVSMHRKIFENSKRQWKKRSIEGVPAITGWLRRIISNRPRLNRTERRHRDQVMNTSRRRIRRSQGKHTENERRQLKLRGFLSRRNKTQERGRICRDNSDSLRHDPWNKKKNIRKSQNKGMQRRR